MFRTTHTSIRLLVVLLIAALALPAAGFNTDVHTAHAAAVTLTVNTTTNAADINPGDDVCDQDAGTAGAQCSLQAAVEEANADADMDTISIPAGTYTTPAQVSLTSDVLITGAGMGSTILVPSANTGGSGDARGWFLVASGITLALSDVTLNGAGYDIYQAIRHRGAGTIISTEFLNIAYPGYAGVAIAAFGGNVDVINSTFTNIGRVGVLYFGAVVSNSTFSGNTYTGKGAGDWLDYALDISAGANVIVTSNMISNNYGVASSDGSESAAVMVTTYYGGGTNADVNNNLLANNSYGVMVGYDGADTSTVVVNNNCIIDNTMGVASTAPLVNAENNWWNDPAGPTDGGFNGVAPATLIDYVPFLTAPLAFCGTVPPAVTPTDTTGPTAEDIANAQAPLCADLDGSTNEIIRADVPGGTVTNGGVYCRVINADGAYVLDYGPAEVGNLDVINLGVLQAVDVFGMRGAESVPAWNNSIQVCLRGAGTFWYLGALDAPRVPQVLASAPNGLGYTCATVYNAGTVVLVP